MLFKRAAIQNVPHTIESSSWSTDEESARENKRDGRQYQSNLQCIDGKRDRWGGGRQRNTDNKVRCERNDDKELKQKLHQITTTTATLQLIHNKESNKSETHDTKSLSTN